MRDVGRGQVVEPEQGVVTFLASGVTEGFHRGTYRDDALDARAAVQSDPHKRLVVEDADPLFDPIEIGARGVDARRGMTHGDAPFGRHRLRRGRTRPGDGRQAPLSDPSNRSYSLRMPE